MKTYNTFMNWTVDQFMLAAMQYKAINGKLPAQSGKGLMEIRSAWMIKNRDIPIDRSILFDSMDGWVPWEPPSDVFGWVLNAFVSASCDFVRPIPSLRTA